MGADDGRESVKKRFGKVTDTLNDIEKETIDALRLSSLCSINTAVARRNLRHQIEKKNVQIYEEFLHSFEKLKDHIESVYRDVTEMTSTIDNMAERLHESKEKTRHLIAQTGGLQEERRRADRQGALAAAFIQHFLVSASEGARLHGTKERDAPLTDDFFVALERVDALQAECGRLARAGHRTVAEDLSERVALHREAAVERLFRWSQHAARAPEPPPLLPRALAELQQRPALFRRALDEYCVARKDALLRSFIGALTAGDSGQAGQSGRPMERRASQPERYIADLLAWIHSALPSEEEALGQLLQLCVASTSKEESQTALAEIARTLCHPLKVRVELALSGDNEPAVLGAVTNILSHYQVVLSPLQPGKDSRELNEEPRDSPSLLDTLLDLQQLSERVFLEATENMVKSVLSLDNRAPPSDLTPAPVVTTVLSFLRSLLSDWGGAGERPHLARATELVVTPLLRSIDESACHLSPADMAVYLLNCAYHVQCTTSLRPSLRSTEERLQARVDAQLDTLTAEQAGALLAELGLGGVYPLLQSQAGSTSSPEPPLASQPAAHPAALSVFMDKLESFILTPSTFLLPQISLLMSSAHRKQVQKRAFEVIAAVYNNLHAAVHNPSNKYDNPEVIVPRSPEEVAQLLASQSLIK